MQVILVKDVEGFGRIGELKDVKEGYGRNFLLPKELAVILSDPRATELLKQKKEKNIQVEQKQKTQTEILAKIAGKKFTLLAKADKKGKLYGSIGPKEIAKKIGIDEKLINQHFKEIGEYDLEIASGKNKTLVKIEIKSEK
jgi:large subunit ribosomal protein L9